MAKRKASELPPPPAPLEAIPTTKFKRDVERQKKRGKDMAKLQALLKCFVITGPWSRGTRIIPLPVSGRAIVTVTSNPTGS